MSTNQHLELPCLPPRLRSNTTLEFDIAAAASRQPLAYSVQQGIFANISDTHSTTSPPAAYMASTDPAAPSETPKSSPGSPEPASEVVDQRLDNLFDMIR
jgi:hypothetical protein